MNLIGKYNCQFLGFDSSEIDDLILLLQTITIRKERECEMKLKPCTKTVTGKHIWVDSNIVSSYIDKLELITFPGLKTPETRTVQTCIFQTMWCLGLVDDRKVKNEK